MVRRLDVVERTPVGSGHLELLGYANPSGFGGRLDYEHRLTEGLSAVAGAGIEHPFALSAFNPYWHAEAGLRWRF